MNLLKEKSFPVLQHSRTSNEHLYQVFNKIIPANVKPVLFYVGSIINLIDNSMKK